MWDWWTFSKALRKRWINASRNYIIQLKGSWVILNLVRLTSSRTFWWRMRILVTTKNLEEKLIHNPSKIPRDNRVITEYLSEMFKWRKKIHLSKNSLRINSKIELMMNRRNLKPVLIQKRVIRGLRPQAALNLQKIRLSMPGAELVKFLRQR